MTLVFLRERRENRLCFLLEISTMINCNGSFVSLRLFLILAIRSSFRFLLHVHGLDLRSMNGSDGGIEHQEYKNMNHHVMIVISR